MGDLCHFSDNMSNIWASRYQQPTGRIKGSCHHLPHIDIAKSSALEATTLQSVYQAYLSHNFQQQSMLEESMLNKAVDSSNFPLLMLVCSCLLKVKEKKPVAGPMHFTANAEPKAIGKPGELPTELEEEVFAKVRVAHCIN